jgi:hypothetical protein
MKIVWLVGMLAAAISTARAADLVKDGKALGAIWHRGDQPLACQDLVKALGQMTGITNLEVKVAAAGEKPAAGQPAIVVGALALELGLPPPPATVSADGYSLLSKGSHLLMAGESSNATRFAATHYLETLGCRWLMHCKPGIVIPEAKTISLGGLDVKEKPDFLFREVWAMQRHWARMGGMDLPNRHDWQHIPADKYFKDHPEYFALQNGERKPGGWVCTSNPDVIRLFAEAYIAKAKAGVKADTISPPDGRGFCQCDACKALDVPGYIEPSNAALSMSDRYARFFNEVAKRVAKEAPDFILSFYAYSDYTLPPKNLTEFSPNLVAWITTIRFCRLHGVENTACESRQRYRGVVEGWAKLMKTASYDYNYNLAEVCVPISKITYIKQNIPYLKKTGCLGVNMEAMAAWNLYGPHTYLTSRLLWDADADPDAILADFYEKAVGKTAAPHLKAYWDRIDEACVKSQTHCGSFYVNHAIWTPELVKACQADLDACEAKAGTAGEKERVALFRSGLENAKYWLSLRDAINTCDFVNASNVLARFIAHMDDANAKGYNTMDGYKRGYVERIVKGMVDSGLTWSSGDRRKVVQLPDAWSFRYDPENGGEAAGWFKPGAPAEGWRTVRTYSATLNEQGIGEQLTWMWYRVKLTPPALPEGPLHLWFGEVDGAPTTVWVNGEKVGELAGRRRAGAVEVTGKLVPGKENEIVVRTNHGAISELMLGGILRPVMLVAGPAVPAPEPPKGK